jgi:translation initiation factor IF-2
MAQEKQSILVPDYVTVRELADLIGKSPIEVMKRLIANGIMASINQQIDYDTAAIVVEEMGFDPQSASAIAEAEARKQRAEQSTQAWRTVYTAEKRENLKTRPPIVTILGHVDHGKTTLLDTIRKANVAMGEAGGITQRIGAYRTLHGERQITFLDTPGHEAFTAMRARGAQGADIAVLVVAADDGVMETTKEALNHARAANVPIVVAITKIDKRNANVERVKKELAEIGLNPDDWGGDTMVVPVSAQQGTGIDDLLEAILLTADEQEIVANPKGDIAGIVLEAQMDSSRGTMATLLVLNGTLEAGDVIVAGRAHGRIRAMFDEAGKPVKKADASTPVRVMGLSEPPQPGERFERVKNDKVARQMIEERQDAADEVSRATAGGRPALTLEDMFAQFNAGKTKDMNLVLKADQQGTLEALLGKLNELAENNEEGIGVRVLLSGVGNISESDIMLASTSGAIVIAFSVSVDTAALRAADTHRVEIRHYDIIYKLLEDLELALKGLLEPKFAEKVIGVAEVRAVFKISGMGNIAGSYIRDGEVRRNAKARVKRAGKVLAENLTIGSLKRNKEDVREVRTGFECGIGLDGFADFQQGDQIEFYVMERVN